MIWIFILNFEVPSQNDHKLPFLQMNAIDIDPKTESFERDLRIRASRKNESKLSPTSLHHLLDNAIYHVQEPHNDRIHLSRGK